ncbi:hypothetical protein [Streptomyces sp. SID10815]|uniref:hypothetical protein n=1 Tax=Streptomyces sp. SID10815 TaxID=2706027 RepID=UPI0013C7F459|nr:hypothetical protein [Streptomyces sp. SID10815]NEA51014.1 hypothetical protein [Streptomyces sp. SID10815]
MTAAGEWELARQVGISRTVAPLLAVVIDVYVLAAVRAARGRDIAAALAVMGGAQVAAHLLRTGHISASVALVAAVSLVAPVVIWRVHALAGAGRAVIAPEIPKPTVDLTRVGTPPWRPVVVKAVSPAPTPRREVATARVGPVTEKAPESPQKPSADLVVRRLYERLGGRPATRHIVEALKAEGLPHSDGTAREARKRVETKEPELKALPLA